MKQSHSNSKPRAHVQWWYLSRVSRRKAGFQLHHFVQYLVRMVQDSLGWRCQRHCKFPCVFQRLYTLLIAIAYAGILEHFG